jgi:hypothetical protein
MLSRLEVPRPPTISGHFSKDLPPQALNVWHVRVWREIDINTFRSQFFWINHFRTCLLPEYLPGTMLSQRYTVHDDQICPSLLENSKDIIGIGTYLPHVALLIIGRHELSAATLCPLTCVYLGGVALQEALSSWAFVCCIYKHTYVIICK